MNKNREPAMVHWQTAFQALENLCLQAYSSLERLIDLNLNDSKTMLLEYVHHAQAVSSATDAQEIVNLQAELCESLLEKSTAYGQHLYTLLTDTGAECSKDFETRWAEARTRLGTRLPQR